MVTKSNDPGNPGRPTWIWAPLATQDILRIPRFSRGCQHLGIDIPICISVIWRIALGLGGGLQLSLPIPTGVDRRPLPEVRRLAINLQGNGLGDFYLWEVAPAVILRRCSRCHETQQEALIWTVGAWVRADGVRVAYKHRLCMTCVASKLAPLYVECQKPDQACPMCHIDTSSDMDPVYFNFIPKGVGMMTIEAPMCAVCAAQVRTWYLQGAEQLEGQDSPGDGRMRRPSPNAPDVLAGLGLADYGTR